MRTLIFTFCFLALISLRGQTDSIFKVRVGTFNCNPDFKLQDSASLAYVNALSMTCEYYDEKKKKYVTKREPSEPQDKFLRPIAPINPRTFFFSERADSTFIIRILPDSIGKLRETPYYKKEVSDNYEFMNLHDSICLSLLDKFWQSTVEITNSGKKQKFRSCAVSILYKDGMFFNTYIKDPVLLNNKEVDVQLKLKLPIAAVSVAEIWFKADNKKMYNISDGFAWKIMDCK
ncbi:MAG: hypothetical protein JNL60_08530 [Bacteroidia bacterium]|nr:hypothetical protein [Bacteroidia bacterium]